MPGKKVANLTPQMFPNATADNEKAVPVKPKNVTLDDVMLRFDKDIYERDFSELQDFNKKLLYKFHNMFAYREQFASDEFIFMFEVLLFNENDVISTFKMNIFDIPYIYEDDLQYTDARDLNRGFKDKTKFHQIKNDNAHFIDNRKHHKDMIHLRKVLEQIK